MVPEPKPNKNTYTQTPLPSHKARSQTTNSDAYVQTEFLSPDIHPLAASLCCKPNTTAIALCLSFLDLHIPLLQLQLGEEYGSTSH